MTLVELRRRTLLPKPYETWRSTPEVVGKINALDRISGMAIATNGIIVAIQTSANAILFGHLQWFIPDKPEDMDKIIEAPRKDKKLSVLDEFTEAT